MNVSGFIAFSAPTRFGIVVRDIGDFVVLQPILPFQDKVDFAHLPAYIYESLDNQLNFFHRVAAQVAIERLEVKCAQAIEQAYRFRDFQLKAGCLLFSLEERHNMPRCV
jgi:hypothetical protein